MAGLPRREPQRDFEGCRDLPIWSALLSQRSPAEQKRAAAAGVQLNDSSSTPAPGEHVRQTISARAPLLDERLDTRRFEGEAEPIATAPLAVLRPDGGVAVLFRYGVIVLLASTPNETSAFLASMASFVAEPLSVPEQEVAQLVIHADADQHIDQIEGFGDLGFVMRQHQALRQHIRHDLQPANAPFRQHDPGRLHVAAPLLESNARAFN
jgi:hypothetical protein